MQKIAGNYEESTILVYINKIQPIWLIFIKIRDKFTGSMKAIVLIADIVSSKKINERNELQKNLNAEIRKINRKSASVLSPMTITLGDEFQCVYSDAGEIFQHIWRILSACYPERIRFSYGIGTITTAINRKQAIGMDGPAFYEARNGLITLKQKNHLFNLVYQEGNSEIVDLIRNTLYLLSYNITGWNKNRIKIMNMLSGEMPVKFIADKLKISEQAVYKNITSGGLQAILDLTKNITVILNNLIKS